jgi:hypothetical protein
MPTLVDIVTNLASTMRAVESAGAVHPRARSARTAEQFARLCAFEGSYRPFAADQAVFAVDAVTDAAAVRRSFVMAEAIERAGHSTSTHTLTCERGKVEVIPIEKKA